jgi:murein DD-endopeptidase MepM/ murein hydrolase activator NlpD
LTLARRFVIILLRLLTIFKRSLVKFALAVFQISGWLSRGFGKGLKFLGKPLFFLVKKTAKYTILPLYKIHNFFKRRILNIYFPVKDRLLHFITQKYIIHVLVVGVALLVSANNIYASDIRNENYGAETAVYALLANREDQIDLIVEKAAAPAAADYQGQMAAVATNTGNANPNANLAESLTSLAAGNTAVLKSNISEELTASDLDRYNNIEHVVGAGDTLSGIANRYGISVNTILWANNLTEKSLLKPGQKLIILPTSGVEYTVKSGDTMASIARKYGIDQSKIVSFNNLEAGKLSAGQKIVIPGGRQITPAAPTKYTAAKPEVTLKNIFVAPTKSTGIMFWPTSSHRINQYYKGAIHAGLDLDGDIGSPIYAADDGVITTLGWNTGGYGNRIIINHGNGVVTLYAHLSKFKSSLGQQVSKGQLIGYMGSTGRSTGPHLHFEVRISGGFKNPLAYIK